MKLYRAKYPILPLITSALVAAVFPWLAWGQASFEAQIRGTVHDTSGGVIAGAKVTLTDALTGIASSALTDSRGTYTFNGLRPSTYKMVAEMAGFRAQEANNVILTVSQHTGIEFTLHVAGTDSTVTVSEAPPTLDTGSAAVGTTVTGQYTRDIPLFGRSYYGLVFLSGGVTESAGSGSRDSYPAGTNFVSNGQRNATAEVRFDGAPISAPEQGEGGNSNVYYTPSVEVIQEFKVENNSFSAEYGNNGGTVINIMMRQGGNQLHGSGWYFGQRDAFNANDFFSNAAGQAKPPLVHDQYGGMISGPIRRNKTFFLFDFEKLRDVGSGQVVGTFPTELQRNGNFSQTQTYNDDGDLSHVAIFNPRAVAADGTRQPFPNNVIPSSMINGVAKRFLAYIPTSNVAGDAGTNYNNYRRNYQYSASQYQLDGKLDHQFNDTNRMGVRYSRLRNNSPTQETFVEDSFLYKTKVQNGVVDYSRTITPTIVYTGRIGIDYANAPGITSYPDLTKAGFPSYLINNGLARMPTISFGNTYSNLFDQCCVDTHFTHVLWTYSSALSWVKGAHSLKFGGEQRLFFNNFWQPDNPTGLFNFGQDVTNEVAGNGETTEGDSFASLLLGWGTDGQLRIKPPVADKSKETGFYVQDDWKVNAKLTLNIGLRYEWSTPYTERFNRSTFADFTTSSGVTVPGLGTINGITQFPVDGRRTLPIDRNNFAPRLGLAYSWDSKTVIRAGAGMYYGSNMQTNFQYTGPAYFKNAVSYFTKDNYLTQYATLENPFPNGVPLPQGNKYGPLAMWGFANGGDLSYELNKNAEIYQWSAGIQRLLPGDVVVSADYSANRSTHLPWGSFAAGTRNRNFVPSHVRVNYTTRQLNSLVANPFQSMFVGPRAIFDEPDSRYNDAQIPLVNLLRPYPQFDGSFSGLPLQTALSRYNSLQLRFQKRSGRYITIQGSYTLARSTDNSSSGANGWIGWLTNGGPQELDRLSGEYGLSANNARQRLAAALTAHIPVGRGLLIGNSMNHILDGVIGGWSGSSNMTFQTGQPVHIQMAQNRISGGRQRPNQSCADPGTGVSFHDAASAALNGATKGIAVLDTTCFADPGDQKPGNTPRYLENLNSQGIANVDIGLRKQFSIDDRKKIQVRMEAFNAFNRTRFNRANFNYGSGSFGQVTGLASGFRPRQLQIVARFEF